MIINVTLFKGAQSSSSGPLPPPIGFISPSQENNVDLLESDFFKQIEALQAQRSSTKQLGMQEGIVRSQSFPYGNYRDVMKTNSSSLTNNQPLKYSNNLAAGTTGKIVNQRANLDTTDKTDGKTLPSASRRTEVGGARNGSLYGPLTNDLIDLGQDDGTNVLEYFDPLFSKPSVVVNPPQHRENMPALKNNSFLMESEESKLPSTNGNKNGTSVSSVEASTSATTNNAYSSPTYGWKSEISLYPSLPPPSSGLYDTLDLSAESRDQSFIYDAYNQFEYLYAVSISSESSNYCYPYDIVPCTQSPTTLTPLPAPTNTTQSSGYVPTHSVRSSKESGKKSSSYQVINYT